MVVLAVIGFFAGLVFLVIGAEGLVRGGSEIARRFGMSPLIVGLTVVAFGTSAPELVVSAAASWSGNGTVAVGNVVGSNILNILMVLGFTALVCPIPIQSQMVRQDIPLLLFISALVWLGMADGDVTRIEGTILVVLMGLYLRRLFLRERGTDYMPLTHGVRGALLAVGETILHAKGQDWKHMSRSSILVGGGIGLLVWGADIVVNNGLVIAQAFGVPDRVVAVTLVAFGTSAPELATSLVAAARGKVDLAIGNAVGSNFLNLYMVLGISALVRPLPVGEGAIRLDLPVMVLASILLLRFATRRGRLHQPEGAIFLAIYGIYAGLLLAGYVP